MSRLTNSTYLRYWLIRHLPSPIVSLLRVCNHSAVFGRLRSSVKMRNLKVAGTPITSADLVRDLHNLGLSRGMKVMVHSSLSGLGFVEGGAFTVIQALLEVIGEDGLLAMPCPPTTGANLESVQTGVAFDPRTTPCTTGKICETFRQRPGVMRSLHPTHSVAATGLQAEWLIKDHHLDPTPFGPHSPFARLLEMDGYLLGIGLDVRWITFYHHFEDVCDHFPVRVYMIERFQVPVLQENGSKILVSVPYHDPDVAAFRLNNDPETLALVDRGLTRYGGIRRSSIGRGQAYLVKATGVFHTLQYLLNENGQTIYNVNLLKKVKPEAIITQPNNL